MTDAERVAILARALSYYANTDNWKPDDWGVMSVIRGSGYGNPASKARSALRRAGQRVPGDRTARPARKEQS